MFDCETDELTVSDLHGFEMEGLMAEPRLTLPVLTYLFERIEAAFDGSPSLLVLDEAWLFLDHLSFAGKIREWLKTLRKKNVSVIFATQSLADIAASEIAPALIESCPSRIFLPNPQAREVQIRSLYDAFGLNARQVEIIATATPKRDYYFQSRTGNRLIDLGLGEIALAFCGASSATDQAAIDDILSSGEGDFTSAWLFHRGLPWAADLWNTLTDTETPYVT